MKYLSKSELNKINTIINNCRTASGDAVNVAKINKHVTTDFYLSPGNEKYKADNNVIYSIFNIPAVITCPYSTPLCRKYCYARKAEKFRPDCLPCRQRNLSATYADSFVIDMILKLYCRLQTAKKTGRKLIVRIHEAGDFYSYEYFCKWMAVAEFFKGEKNIHFGAYTKSSPYLLQAGYKHKMFNHVTINGSVWQDTETDRLTEYAEMNLPTYTALPEKEITADKNIFKCECAGCGSSCTACFCNLKKYQQKAVAIH